MNGDVNDGDNKDQSQYNSTFSSDELVCPLPNCDGPKEPNEVDQTCENIQCGVFLGTIVALTAAAAVHFVGNGTEFAKVESALGRHRHNNSFVTRKIENHVPQPSRQRVFLVSPWELYSKTDPSDQTPSLGVSFNQEHKEINKE